VFAFVGGEKGLSRIAFAISRAFPLDARQDNPRIPVEGVAAFTARAGRAVGAPAPVVLDY